MARGQRSYLASRRARRRERRERGAHKVNTNGTGTVPLAAVVACQPRLAAGVPTRDSRLRSASVAAVADKAPPETAKLLLLTLVRGKKRGARSRRKHWRRASPPRPALPPRIASRGKTSRGRRPPAALTSAPGGGGHAAGPGPPARKEDAARRLRPPPDPRKRGWGGGWGGGSHLPVVVPRAFPGRVQGSRGEGGHGSEGAANRDPGLSPEGAP